MSSLVPGLRHQKLLERVVNDLFDGYTILYDARKEAKIINPETGKFLELDIWIPSVKLAFEFQDPHHYITTWESNIPLGEVKFKDDYKFKVLKERGETLISVPCWWDGRADSLVSTIRLLRPELLTSYPNVVDPISVVPPAGFFIEKGIPGIGELMLASFSLSPSFKMKSWWMGEKYDGIRACWHPENSVLYSRQGTELTIPPQCARLFPSTFLDSEIWSGRGFFPESRRFSTPNAWASFRIVCFDNADTNANQLPFEKRYTQILDSIEIDHPFLVPAPRVRIINRQHMHAATSSILSDSGEGIITRRPNSIYENGRSSSLFKFKASRADREALVVAKEADGSFLLELPEGTLFYARVPTLLEGEVRPATGDVITFAYEKFSRNVVPVNPKIFRVRDDMAWRDVVRAPQTLNASTQAGASFSQFPMGYWSIHKGKNARLFFEKLAKSKNMDPLVPDTWYTISKEDILSKKGGPTILNRYGGSAVRALLDVFNEIGLDPTKFHRILKAYWDKKEHRRRFFEKYAIKHNFDPLVPANWYSISRRSIERYKSGRTVLGYYKRSLVKALVDLFSEIHLDPKQFQYLSKPKEDRNDWSDQSSRKQFLDNFAMKKGFDPLVANNWHSVETSDIIQAEGQSLLNRYYGGSLVKALQSVYPHISFSSHHFKIVPRTFWEDTNNQREFFKNFASKAGFDYKIPSNWYSISNNQILQAKGGESILKHYNKSMATAMQALFPEMALDLSRFGKVPQNYWTDEENRKRFFQQVADIEGFPIHDLSRWSSISSRSLYRFKGARAVLGYHNNSVTKAISDLFKNNTK